MFPVEIHHIVPQEEGGPDTEDNAAPLCPTCHETWGANPTKRKLLREARDHWYDLCDRSVPTSGLTIEELRQELPTKADLEELKALLVNALPPASKEDDEGPIDQEEVSPVPLDAFIASLYAVDYGHVDDWYKLFFDSRVWLEPGSGSYALVDSRSRFLQLFGEQTARRVCLRTMADTFSRFNDFKQEELDTLAKNVQVTVTLILLHEQLNPGSGVQCALRSDGEFMWRRVGDGKDDAGDRRNVPNISPSP